MSFVGSMVGEITNQQVELKEYWRYKLEPYMRGICRGSVEYYCPYYELYKIDWLNKQPGIIIV